MNYGHVIYTRILRYNAVIESSQLFYVYLLSAHSIRYDARGANYYYPSYARLSQQHTWQTRKNPTRYPFTTPGSRETIVNKVPCLGAHAPSGIRTQDPLITSREHEPLHHKCSHTCSTIL